MMCFCWTNVSKTQACFLRWYSVSAEWPHQEAKLFYLSGKNPEAIIDTKNSVFGMRFELVYVSSKMIIARSNIDS